MNHAGIFHVGRSDFPVAVKDLMPVKGIRMTMGSPIFKDFVPDADGSDFGGSLRNFT